MDNWYCKEFIHSSQAALRMVFNIDNCLDMSRVLSTRPNRPPDSLGRESYVYIMDGDKVRNIKDLAIDELTPWNSRSCKSSTRFSAIHYDSTNNIILRRYIISEGGEKPNHLLACYYCKHPVFKLTKKIFYACDGNRERCLPNTFAIFIYEFEQAEKLHITRKLYYGSPFPTGPGDFGGQRSTSNNNLSVQMSSNDLSHDLSKSSSYSFKNEPSSSSFIGDDFSQADVKNGGGIMFDQADSSNFGFSADQNPINSNGLDNLLKYPANNFFNKRLFNEFKTPFGDHSAPRKRRKPSIPIQPAVPFVDQPYDFENSPNTMSVCKEADGNSLGVTDSLRYFFTIDAMVENFKMNCLCDSKSLSDYQNNLEEKLNSLPLSNFNNDNISESIDSSVSLEEGGCLIADETFSVDRFFVTIVWFRNPTFIQNGQPVIHPIALLFSSSQQADDLQSLLVELQVKVGATGIVCRSFLGPYSYQVERSSQEQIGLGPSGSIAILEAPCIHLSPTYLIGDIIRQKCMQVNISEDEALKINEDIFGCVKSGEIGTDATSPPPPNDGILNSLTFEEFVRKLRLVEKNWNSSAFKSWFREKSGWMFERCSLGSWLKAGFSCLDSDCIKQAMTNARISIKQKLESAISDNPEDFENIVLALEDICEEILINAAQAICSDQLQSSDVAEDDQTCENNAESSVTVTTTSIKLCQSKAFHAISRSKWQNLSLSEKRLKLVPLGLSSLRLDGLMDSLDPIIFSGMSRSEKNNVRSQASQLEVISLDGRILPHRYPTLDFEIEKDHSSPSSQNFPGTLMDFVVADPEGKISFFVSLSEGSSLTGELPRIYCQCQMDILQSAEEMNDFRTFLLCPHLCAVAISNTFAARMIANARAPRPPILEPEVVLNNCLQQDTSFLGMGNYEHGAEFSPHPLPFKFDSSTVEIIHCSNNSL